MGKKPVTPTELDGGAIAVAVELTRERGWPDVADRLDAFGMGERETVYEADLYIAKNSLQDADKRKTAKRFKRSMA